MNNIEDYDDNLQSLQKQLDRLFKKSKTAVILTHTLNQFYCRMMPTR